MFYFITFCINYAVILTQFILSMLSDKPSIYHYVNEDDVREIHSFDCLGFMLCTFDVSTETMPRVVSKFPICPDHVVAQWVRSMCGSVVCKGHTD